MFNWFWKLNSKSLCYIVSLGLGKPYKKPEMPSYFQRNIQQIHCKYIAGGVCLPVSHLSRRKKIVFKNMATYVVLKRRCAVVQREWVRFSVTSSMFKQYGFFLLFFCQKNAASLIYWEASAAGRLEAEDDCLGVRF